MKNVERIIDKSYQEVSLFIVQVLIFTYYVNNKTQGILFIVYWTFDTCGISLSLTNFCSEFKFKEKFLVLAASSTNDKVLFPFKLFISIFIFPLLDGVNSLRYNSSLLSLTFTYKITFPSDKLTVPFKFSLFISGLR